MKMKNSEYGFNSSLLHITRLSDSIVYLVAEATEKLFFVI